jgi:hypothetical protein
MRCGRGVRLGLFVAVAAAALIVAPGALAITKQKATQIALKRLKPQNEIAAVVLSLPATIGPKVTVGESSLGENAAKPKAAGRRAWLFWEDLSPYALFAHPSRLVLVDDKTGRIIRDQRMMGVPLVRGRVPVFLTSEEAYESARYRVFPVVSARTTSRPPAGAAPLGANINPNVPNFFTKDDFVGDCFVIVGAYDDFRIKESFDIWEKLADRLGIPRFRVPKPEDGYPDSSHLAEQIATLVKPPHNCKDILIFLGGHGTPFPGMFQDKDRDGKLDATLYNEDDPFRDGGTWNGNYETFEFNAGSAAVPSVETTPLAKDATPGTERSVRNINTFELRDIFDDYDGVPRDPGGTELKVTFKLAIEACFSGRMINDLNVNKPSNLLVATASSGPDEVSYGRLGAPRGKTVTKTITGVTTKDGKRVLFGIKLPIDGSKRPDDVQVGEYTGSIVNGFVRAGSTQSNVEKIRAVPGPTLVTLVAVAPDVARSTDLARSSGATHPRTIVDPSACPPQGQRAALTFPGERGDLVFQSERGGDFGIYRAGPTGTNPTLLVDLAGRDEFNAASSPDGSQIVFQSGPAGVNDFDLYLLDLEGDAILPRSRRDRHPFGGGPTEPVPLVGGPQSVRAAQFCDADTIVYTLDVTATNSDIYAIETDGTGRRRITSGPGIESFPSCHPSGQRLAFNANRDGLFEIWEINLDGTGLRKLVSGLSLDPDYSPDGLSLAYVSLDPQDGNPEIFTRNLATGDVAQRTVSTGVENRLPHFAPDSTTANPVLVFTRRTPAVGRGALGELEFDEELREVNHADRLIPAGPGSGGSWRPAPIIGIAC